MKEPQQFLLKSDASIAAKKVAKYLGYFSCKNYSQELSKSPKLVILFTYTYTRTFATSIKETIALLCLLSHIDCR